MTHCTQAGRVVESCCCWILVNVWGLLLRCFHHATKRGRRAGWTDSHRYVERSKRRRDCVGLGRVRVRTGFFCQADIDFGKNIFMYKIRIRFVDVVVRTFCWLKSAITPEIAHKTDFVYACRNFAKGRWKGIQDGWRKKLTLFGSLLHVFPGSFFYDEGRKGEIVQIIFFA